MISEVECYDYRSDPAISLATDLPMDETSLDP